MLAATTEHKSTALDRVAQLAAETSSVMNAKAGRYSDLILGMQRLLDKTRVQQSAAWRGGNATVRRPKISPHP